jgi:hypothetical protein
VKVEYQELNMMESPSPSLQITNTVTASGAARAFVAGRNINIDAAQHHYYERLGLDPLSDKALVEATRDFVATSQYVDMCEKFIARDHIVVVCGARHSGRKTVALNLLSRARIESETSGRPLSDLWRLRTSWLYPSVHAIPRVEKHGFILDLSEAEDEESRPSSRFGEDLVKLSPTLAQLGSYLVVVTTHEVWQNCSGSTDSITFPWNPPAPPLVVNALLEGQLARPDRTDWILEYPLRSLLDDADLSPGDAARLAHAIARAEPVGKMSAQDVALDEFIGWSGYLSDWFRRNADVYARAYLIAAAVLNGAVDRDVISAGDRLLRIAGEQEDSLKPLQGPDISERLAKTEATVDKVSRRVWLTDRRPGIDSAVVDHLLRERPHLREMLLAWLVDLAAAPKTSAMRRERIASVLAGVWIRRKEKTSLVDFARDLAKRGPLEHDLAVRVLDACVLDPDIGQHVRTRLNAWASAADPVRLSLTVAVCGLRLGVERTSLALKRLSKVLTNKTATQEVIQSAGRALTQLALHAETRLSVVEALTRLVQDTPTVGAKTFLELARVNEQSVVPSLLSDAMNSAEIRKKLADLWLATYRAVGADECAPVMCSWVEAVPAVLPEEVVLDVCMPTLRLTAAHSLGAKVVTAAPPDVAERIMSGLISHVQSGTK